MKASVALTLALAAALSVAGVASALEQGQDGGRPGRPPPASTAYRAPDGYRDQRALPDAHDPAAREALLQARGEAYRRAPDSQQTEAELAATRALNAEIVAQNDLAAKQEEADRLAHDAALARYQIEVRQTEERAHAEAEAARAAQDQYDRDYAAWMERVKACQSGVRAACAVPNP
ncbi:hypothetical protein MU852_07675 [Brevundimonas albigilva]|uniref:hypothetical protein n=1 Tax=Brevundimonas albigilva TaxID=1312364 RepID=UPI00201B57D2|nr:hypothetical protein [Brevundimonas albigilva]UQV19607.1 hypothetical protein MU852_07675 [Brevundimonas albigilva]